MICREKDGPICYNVVSNSKSYTWQGYRNNVFNSIGTLKVDLFG